MPTLSDWTSRSTGFGTSTCKDVVFGAGLFVTFGTSGKLATSPDAATWTLQTSSFGTSIINGMVYAAGLFVAVGQSGKMATSTDGITWTQITSSFGTTTIQDVVYANGLFVAVGDSGKIATSTDGATWTQITSSFGTTAVYAAVYAADLGLWVITGSSGKMATSTDAATWTQVTSTSFSTITISGIYYAAGLFVAVATANGSIATSTNGTTWTQRTSGFVTTGVQDVHYAGGLWIIVGNSGHLATSEDGITWTLIWNGGSTEFGTSVIAGVNYVNDLWFISGGNAKLATAELIVALVPVMGQVAITGLAPTLMTGFIAAANQAGINIIGHSPIFLTSASAYLTPVSGLIALTGRSPTFLAGSKITASSQCEINITGLAPSFSSRIFTIITPGAIATRYKCVLTGAPDGLATDLELPISSFQSRLRNTGLSYLSVVLNGAGDYIDAIAARSNGELKVWRQYVQSDGTTEDYLMAVVDYDTLQLYQGPKAGTTAQLSGTGSLATTAPQSVSLNNATYYSLSGGLKRYRCEIDPRLRPGDTALIEGDSFTVGTIIHIIDSKYAVMEIAE